MEIVAETRVQSLRTRGTTDNTRNLYGALKYSFLTLAKFSRNKTIHFQSGIVQLYPLSLAHTGVLRCILSGYDPYKPPPPNPRLTHHFVLRIEWRKLRTCVRVIHSYWKIQYEDIQQKANKVGQIICLLNVLNNLTPRFWKKNTICSSSSVPSSHPTPLKNLPGRSFRSTDSKKCT